MVVSQEVIENRQDLASLLQCNTDMVILKFGAEWCGPCKKIDHIVHEYMERMPNTMTCMVLDIDECFDIYAYLKSKKVTPSIPVLLAYKSGNTNACAPDHVMIGSDGDVKGFFSQAIKSHNELLLK